MPSDQCTGHSMRRRRNSSIGGPSTKFAVSPTRSWSSGVCSRRVVLMARPPWWLCWSSSRLLQQSHPQESERVARAPPQTVELDSQRQSRAIPVRSRTRTQAGVRSPASRGPSRGPSVRTSQVISQSIPSIGVAWPEAGPQPRDSRPARHTRGRPRDAVFMIITGRQTHPRVTRRECLRSRDRASGRGERLAGRGTQ